MIISIPINKVNSKAFKTSYRIKVGGELFKGDPKLLQIFKGEFNL